LNSTGENPLVAPSEENLNSPTNIRSQTGATVIDSAVAGSTITECDVHHDCEHSSHGCSHEGDGSECAGSECAGSESAGDHDHSEEIRGSAMPEIAAMLPRQIRVRAWESPVDASARPKPSDLPPVPDRIHRRWDRFVRLVGNQEVRTLLGSHVTIFGLGGVGSYVAEALARSAVGRLSLVDFDDVCVTNVNRQLQAFPATVGQSKAQLLAERVRAIHPEAWVDPIQAFYDASTSDALLTPRPDFVVDAIDNVTSKVLLLETCLKQGIPVISVTGSGARLDPTQVRVDDLSRTKVDPLARVIRKELAKRGFGNDGEVGLPVVFSEEEVRQPEVPEWDVDNGFQCICPHRADSPHACEKRRVIYGTATFMTAAFAMAATSVVIRRLTGK
jgi:tRNA A37 threonylcarbamoyladenosine dehydratase